MKAESYPVALPDPVTEPPVAERDAAGGEEEEEDVHDEGQRSSGSLDVSSVHGPGHGPAPLFLRLHELICVYIRQQKERRTTEWLIHPTRPKTGHMGASLRPKQIKENQKCLYWV